MEWNIFFSEVPDFRIARGKLHLLSDILMLSLCAVISGAEDYEDVANYGREKEDFLKTFLSLPNGIPSHDTICRVFRRMDKAKFSETLFKWSAEILDFMTHYRSGEPSSKYRWESIARYYPSREKKSGLCLVSAWASEQRLCLGQLKTEEKSNAAMELRRRQYLY